MRSPNHPRSLEDDPDSGKVSEQTPIAFLLDKDPQTQYLYPLHEAGGFELVEACEPKRETKRTSVKEGGTARRRKQKIVPGRIYVPLVMDTEFQTIPNPESGWFHDSVLEKCHELKRGSIPLTVQIKGITERSPSAVYLHPDYKRAFPKAKPNGVETASEPIAHYLEKCFGQKVRFDWCGDISDTDYRAISQRRKLRIHVFAHFALAEVLRIWGDRRIVDHAKDLCRVADEREEPWIQSGRRVRTCRKVGNNPKPDRWLPIPLIAVIGRRKFAVEIDIYDNSAMLGNAGRSLAGFHQVAGVPMDAKDNYERKHKERMILQFIAGCDSEGLASGAYRGFLPRSYNLSDDTTVLGEGDPNIFLDYAKGDVLTLYKAITGVVKQFQSVYKSLGLDDYYKDPKPTTGSTVHDLIKAAVFSQFDYEGAFQNQDFFLTKTEENGYKKGLEWCQEYEDTHGKPSMFAQWPHWHAGTGPLKPKFQKLIQDLGFKPAEAQRLATAKDWSGLNAKVMGGRCISSAPTMSGVKGQPIADVDLAGCYVAAMYQQQFPIGRPVIIGGAYKRDSKRNNYQTLREFLAEYRHELVPSLWQLWISCEDRDGKPLELPCDQDYFPSWDAPPSFFDYAEDEEGIWLERNDQVRHYLREIVNTVLTNDGLEWLENVASRTLRNFILDHGLVKTAMFYPKSERLRNSKQFVDKFVEYEENRLIKEFNEKHSGNRSKAVIKSGRTKVIDQQQEFHGWFSMPLSDLIADGLKKKRAEWKTVTKAYKAIKASEVEIHNENDLQKLNEGARIAVNKVLKSDTLGTYPGGLKALVEEAGSLAKHPLDELFKLCGNTVYGVVVSRFFALSNPVVGNNITARCRSVIALYQAACRGWNAITDGGLMRLDQVFYPRRKDRRLTEQATMMVEATKHELNKKDLVSACIGRHSGYDFTSIHWDGDDLVFESKEPEDCFRFHKSNNRGSKENPGYLDFIDKLILDHVRKSFPEGISVLDGMDIDENRWEESPFTFESKGVVQDACIHGAGNYYLRGGWHEGYPKDGQARMVKMRSYSSRLHETRLIPFFEQLLDDPSKIDRTVHSQPFINSTILKVGDFNQGYEPFYKHTIVEPGDTIYDAKIFRELGLTGFRFKSREQEKYWRREHERNRIVDREKPSIGQSYEGYFTDENDVLDYQRMLKEVNEAIQRGLNNLPGKKKESPQNHLQVAKLQEIRNDLRGMLRKKKNRQLDFYEQLIEEDFIDAGGYRERELIGDDSPPDYAWF